MVSVSRVFLSAKSFSIRESWTESVKDHLAIGNPIDLQQYCQIIIAGRTDACPPGVSIISDANGVKLWCRIGVDLGL